MNLIGPTFRSLMILVVMTALHSTGCVNNCCCQKERSFLTAISILQRHAENDVFKAIRELEDIEALRIIAVSSRASAWPMEAGPDINFDNRMDDIALAAIQKLYLIDSSESREAIEYCQRFFEKDGARSQTFKEWENKKRERH